MPLHKIRPSTRRSCSGSNTQVASGTESYSSTHIDKSSQAARMAQELASHSSWADTYGPRTPATTATPAESIQELDSAELPPSYEESRAERELPSIPQSRQENVRSESSPSPGSNPNPSRDVEAGANTPLLMHHEDVVEVKRRRQKRFVIVFIILAVWLMGLQALKGFGIGFWRADGTPIPPLPHRKYVQHETNRAISGTFTFYDELDLSTTSGSINIVIDPQPSDKVGVIRITTRAGSIKVKFTDEYVKAITESGLLDRVYDIEIRSSVGSINVELPQGNGGLTSLITESSSISAKLLTTHLGRSKNNTVLTTQTASGSQTINFKALSSEPMTSLAARHYSTGSGSIKVGLPPVWQGMVHASVGGSASVDVKGDGLQYQRNGGKEVYAWRVRGDEKEGQVVEVRGDGSGSIKVDCSAS